MKIYDYKLTKSLSWCFVLCMSLFVTANLSAQPEEIVCDDKVHISLGTDCDFTPVAGLFTEFAPAGEAYFYFDGTTVDGVPKSAEGPIDVPITTLPCGTYTVTVVDASGNNCWGTVVIEDKLPPTFINPCPLDGDCEVSCFDAFDLEGNITIQSTALSALIASVEDCSGPVQYIVDSEIFNGTCTTPGYLSVRVEMIDQKGNQSEAILYWEIIDDIINPPLAIVDGECEWDESPNALARRNPMYVPWIATPLGPSPVYINEARVFEGCNKLVTYDDLTVPACGGEVCGKSRKIIRTWRLIDWCGNDNTDGQPFTRTLEQIISLKDETPPIVYNSGTYTVSVEPWSCSVERYQLPDPVGEDNCMGELQWNVVAASGGPSEVIETVYEGGHWYALNMPKGTHGFIYWADDCCGNEGQGFVVVNVVDNVKPVAIAKQFTVISLSNVNGTDDGIAKMYAESLDNGSYDLCTDVKLEIRRDGYFTDGADDLDYLGNATGSAGCPVKQYPCDLVGNDTYDNTGHDWDIPNGCNGDIDPDGGRYVKFCCGDISEALHDVNYDDVPDMGYHKVWLRVWDDADMDGYFGSDGDNYNETWGYVKVEVSAPPVLHVEDATIQCDWPWEEKYEEGYFNTSAWIDAYATYSGICDVSVDVELYEDNTEDCPVGDIVLKFTATNADTKGLKTVDYQTIYIDGFGDSRCDDFNWPPSYSEVGCEDDIPEPELTWDADPCDLIGWTVRTDVFVFGPSLDEEGCKKIINEYTVIDWCQFDYFYNGRGGGDPIGSGEGKVNNGYFEFEGGHDYLDGELCEDPIYWPDGRGSENGVFKYVEIIKVVDDIPPVIEETDQTMYEVDINCEAQIRLVNSASDAGCQGNLRWEVNVDMDADGVYEEHEIFTTDRFGGVLKGAELDFMVYNQKDNKVWTVDEGNMYTFNVLYKVTDGCGNVDKEESTVMVVDKKDPTPYCIHLSSAVMENGQVELWAVDFNVGSFDNCTDAYGLLYTFNEEHPVLSKLDKEHFFKGEGLDATAAEYETGDAQKWIPQDNTSGRIFDCDDVAASPVDVRMTVWDEKLNSDWCSVELTLIDNQGACDDAGARASVSGNVATEESSDVSLVEVTLENLSNPEYELTVTTGNDGDFAFASNPMYNGYDISAVKDGDDLEGVSTLDLVHIQRHILGITSFESPYKVIAADINSDRRVSGTDLVVLRKVILGIYKEFPTNNSWRFVEKSQSLTVENALTDFNEVINIQALDANMSNEDFIAVKIGDVNATAKTNARDLGTQTRSAGTVTLELMEQNVRKGDLVDLTFSSKNFNEVYGYQFTLELDGLTLETVTEGTAIMTDANIGVLDNNTLTVSYSDISGLNASDNMFTLTVKAAKDGAISNMIALTNTALNSEAYVGTGLDINTVELTINGEEVNSFRLDQNEPNPFDETTVVGFVLPEAGNALITVYNVAGKLITSLNGQFAQGYNEVRFTKDELNTTGVLYYTLQSGDFTATKKMIIIE